jgi:hypothetical protein
VTYRVVYEFHHDEVKAKSSLKKIPKVFSHPKIYTMKDETFAVLAGEYDKKEWADAAVKKLYECGLWGGLLQEE